MISVNNVSVHFGSFELFDEVSFVISAKERIALTGRNGAGKSTMLKLIAGIESPTSGSVDRPRSVKIGYLPQVMQHVDGKSVYEECETVFSHIKELQAEVDALAEQMSLRTDYDSADYAELIDLYSRRSDELNLSSSGSYHAFIERTLMGLGFEREDFHRACSEFSGGWRMRIELAKILLQKPDLLLLDEPTNHLDLESIQWLERFVSQGSSALLLISHDRAFLDATTTRTIEIELGRIYDYKTHYSHYEQLRLERLEQQRRAYENQQKSIKATEDFIERFRYKATKAVQVQSRIKQLERVERIELDELDTRSMHFSFTPAVPSGMYPVVAEGLAKSYGAHTVFSDLSLTIKRGEKIALVGKNGSGKSTFIKCLMGEVNDWQGKLELGHQVQVGYFAQTQTQELNPNLTIYETIDAEAKGEIRTHLRDILGAFMFGGELADKKVGVLSGGERGRIALIKLLLRPANLLVLDEPTNHLDIRSKEVLKEAIARFDGTVILVSHDRVFLDGLVDRIFEFKRGKVTEHMGGIYDWLHKRALEAEEPATPRVANATSPSKTVQSLGAQDYAKQKEATRRIRAVEREVARIEQRTEAIDQELAQIEQELSSGSTADLLERYQKLKEEQDALMLLWEEQSLLLESLTQDSL